jgi:hypothetical protein
MAYDQILLSRPTCSTSPRKGRAETDELCLKAILYLKQQACHINSIFNTLTDKIMTAEVNIEKLAHTNRKLYRQLRFLRRSRRSRRLGLTLSKSKGHRKQSQMMEQDLTTNVWRLECCTCNMSNSDLGLHLPLRPKEGLK